MKNQLKKNLSTLIIFFLLFVFAIIISLPFLKDTNPIRANDLMVGISSYAYIKESLVKFQTFPQWNSFIGTGIPLVSDPLNNFLNPLVIIPFLLFPFIASVKIILFLCVLLSGISCYLLNRFFQVGKVLSILTSATYMCSGFLIARIAAGHFEWIITYPFVPLFFFALFKLLDKKNILWAGVISLILTLFTFSGNLYAVFYSLLIMFFVSVYLLISYVFDKKNRNKLKRQVIFLSFSVFLFPLFSFAKLLPVTELLSSFSRSFDPFLGSQNIFSLIFNFFIPSEEIYKYFGIDNYLQSPYFWWESFAYIGPFFLAGIIAYLVYIKRVKKDLLIVLYLVIVLILYSFLGNQLSPFYWLTKYIIPMQTFRIPSRIFLFIIPLFIILSNTGIAYMLKRRKKIYLEILIFILLSVNLFSVYNTFKFYYYTRNFPHINSNFFSLLDYLKNTEKNYNYIAENINFENQLPLYYSVHNQQKIFDPNGGWGLKDNPAGKYATAEVISTYKYNDVQPKYFLYPSKYSPPKVFETKIVKDINGTKLYENSKYTPYAYTSLDPNGIRLDINEDSNIKSLSINVNKISILAYSPDDVHFLILQENNFSDWKLKINKQEKNIVNNRFLVAKMEKGTHLYSYTFFSNKFIAGLFITIFSISLWLFIVLFGFKKKLKHTHS